MKYALIALMTIAFSIVSYAQADLPEIGKVSDVQGKTKVYVSASGQARKSILKQIKKSPLIVVDKAGDSDFVLEYKTLHQEKTGTLQLTEETGQLEIYFWREKSKVIAYSESGTGSFKNDTPTDLTAKFLKAYSKKSN